MRVRVWKGVAAGWLLLAAMLGGECARGQAGTTTVQDTVTNASGVAEAGTLVVSWGAFTTAAGVSVPAGSLSTALGSGGALRVALLPNADATPMGSYYTAVYHLTDGTTSREFWVVPLTGSGTVTLAGIRNQVLPTSMAMQAVSKGYVDTTVAKAMAGTPPGGALPYLLRAGDAMTGPLTLPGDPANALQAADKHYVDAVAAAGLTTGSTAGGDLSGTYPNPAVAAVHATAGTLDGVTIGGSSAKPATFAGTDSTPAITMSSHTTIRAIDGNHQIALADNTVWDTWDGFQVFLDKYSASIPALALGNTPSRSNGGGTNMYIGIGTANPTQRLTVGTSGLFTVDDAGNAAATAFHETLTTPPNSTASCSAGDFTDDASFHYVCVANSLWKRVALSSF